MKKSLFILFLLVSVISYSQDKDNYSKVVADFQSLYNEGNYNAIYYMFNYDMKKAMPLAKTRAFFADLNSKLGKITQVEFNKIKDLAHIYIVTFASEVRDITFYLDNNNKIGGLLVTYHKPDNLPVLDRNTTKMILPFNEEWFVFWGGIDKKNNYHVAHENQKYAYDILIIKDDASFSGDPKVNENYYAYGKDIIAPCDAKVVKVITGVKDNIPGELNSEQLTGNTIVLETNNKEYILFAHLKENSIAVREGQFIRKGGLLGKCGNSGNTTEPHLHLSLQNTLDMNIATGAKLYFDRILVNGELQLDYLPVKGDAIKNRD
ncbi:peptidoglycan DD-metalloendopeptidase family protein [Formosa maritima]|uniref:Peptidoglycan DD-metalloendopeptidase family protein n=1 Tax=Formosa maritima TaxID=2592046 RepID=A0A5D0G1K4_9FLAO|nr:peptidoglycan DD-metalloendopeptidase family protein [Formosa maritima]TYA52440.1 peptidoglycan DD-metalloendopeptidase family protein [Formosa maritima]